MLNIFFFHCPYFQDQRNELLNAVLQFQTPSLSLLLYGDISLLLEINKTIFENVQRFIVKTKRFYAPPQKVAGYYVIPSELLSVCPSVRPSVCPSVRPSVRPSAVEHSCPVHNFDTVRDNFTKLGTNINHDQTTCRD